MNRSSVAWASILIFVIATSPVILTPAYGATDQPTGPVHNINTGLDYTTIQQAIDAPETLDGHTIGVDAGTYYEHVAVSKSLTLGGEGSLKTTLVGDIRESVITITAGNVSLSGFAVRSSVYASTGILLDHSSNNAIYENDISNTGNIGIGVFVFLGENNSVTANKVTGTGIYIQGSNNTVSQNKIGGTGTGIFIEGSNNTVSQNLMTNTEVAIYIQSSSYNSVSGNDIEGGTLYDHPDGIVLDESSNHNIVSENRVTNQYIGIGVIRSEGDTVTGNNITDTYFGILFQTSTYSIISGNSLVDDFNGIQLAYRASNNEIYHNSFVRNPLPVNLYDSYGNTWDDGYPSGGNFWSDYPGADTKSGSNQDQSGSDGIGDTPYTIDADNQDRYPLMKPWAPIQLFITAAVNVDPYSVNPMSRARWLTAYIELPERFDTAKIDLSSIRLNGTIPMAPGAPTAVGDYDNDGVPDLMVKFDMLQVKALFSKPGNYSLQVTGNVMERRGSTMWIYETLTPFMGSDVIRVLVPGDVNSDGRVDIIDVSQIAFSYGSSPCDQRWQAAADLNEDGIIDITDVATAAFYYGTSY